MNLVQTLNALGKEINEKYPRINYGGCCVYATIVGEELTKRGIEVRGVVGSLFAGRYTNIDEVRPKLKRITAREFGDNGVYFGHVALEFTLNGRVKHYDTYGVVRKGKTIMRLPVYNGRMKLEEMKKLASRKDGWNDWFNRRHIPAIRKTVKAYFEQLDAVS